MNASTQHRSLDDVLATLEREGLLEPGRRESLSAGQGEPETPWFVRAMVGFGAWLAALLLIAFVAGISVLATEGGFLILGFVFIVAALMVRRGFDNDFACQLTLAMSLAGQGLLAAGILSSLGGDNEIELMLVTLAAVNALMIAIFPDNTHRFLSTVAIVVCTCILLYIWRAQVLMPFVGPLLAAVLILLSRHEAAFARGGWLAALSAVRAGLLVGAFGCLMLSTFYLLPDLGDRFVFYPRPWISTLLLGALLLWLERDFMAHVFADATAAERGTVYVLTMVVIAASWLAPGLVLALVTLVLGGVIGSRLYRGAGIAFLAVFMGTYFYGIEIGMLAKSASLIAVGLVVLGCRWLFARSIGARHGGGDVPGAVPRGAGPEVPDA